MGTAIEAVRRGESVIGYVTYSTTSDTWSEPIWETREEAKAMLRKYYDRRCTNPPQTRHRLDEHPRTWVTVGADGQRLQACLSGRCIISPPWDAYLRYPKDWKAT